MIKTSFFPGQTDNGPVAIPLFTGAVTATEKTAAAKLLPEVVTYIEGLRPQKGSQYVLVNAMGAGEFWGSNINGDHFPEAGLIHRPDNWKGLPAFDKIASKTWPYGYPTFYGAHPYAHHRNKDAKRAFGEVELVSWNDAMKRVELVVRVDEAKCHEFGGTSVWDKLIQGQFPDVSMGCKVPFDTCSICLDWETYKKAMATFKPGKHRHPGQAILEYHKALFARDGKGIRGLSPTVADYCEHTKKSMNKILPDGRKVFVYNDFPFFFDISFVFIGADKTAKTMLKIAMDVGSENGAFWSIPSADLAERLGYVDTEKTASTSLLEDTDLLKLAFLGKGALAKKSEIEKDVIPSQFASKAIPAVTKSEPELPEDLLDMLGGHSFEDALSSTASLGITLRPREFQRIVIISMGNKPLADDLDKKNVVFPKSDEKLQGSAFGEGGLRSAFLRALLPFLEDRSVFGPPIERRAVRVLMKQASPQDPDLPPPSSLSLDLLRKIGAAYNTYRSELMNKIAESQDKITQSGIPIRELVALAQLPADELFTPMSAAHLKLAYWGEVGIPGNGAANPANVERGTPSKNTFDRNVTSRSPSP